MKEVALLSLVRKFRIYSSVFKTGNTVGMQKEKLQFIKFPLDKLVRL